MREDTPTPTGALSIARLLTLPTCPEAWLPCDLYLIRHGSLVFYVGQSDCAFTRVWRHIQDGFKGRSELGKFIRNNWHLAMHFDVDLFVSALAAHGRDRDQAERLLIERHRPCFNRSHNRHPTQLPDTYCSPQVAVPYPKNLRRMMQEAERVVQQNRNRRRW